MKKMIWAVMLVTAMAGQAAPQDLPDPEAVIQRFIEAVGGSQALEDRAGLGFEGVIIQDLTWTDPQHTETPFVAWAGLDGRVLYAEKANLEDLPGIDTGEPTGLLRFLMHPRFALMVQEFYPGLTQVTREVRDGRLVLVLGPGGENSWSHALYFDEGTGLLSHVGYHHDLQEWREAQGVLFPHAVVFGRKGGHTTYQFDKICSHVR